MAGEPEKVGLVVVHGIGDQRRGETAGKIVSAIVAGDGCLAPTRIGDTAYQIDGGARVVRVYEAHWADVLRPERGAYDVAKLQGLALFPRLNRKHGLYPQGMRPGTVWLWTARMAFISAAVFLASYGLNFVGSIVDSFATEKRRRRRREERSAAAKGKPPHRRPWQRVKASLRRRWREQREEERNRYPWVEQKLDNVAGDIFRYVDAACPEAEVPSAADEILDRFHETLRRPFEDGCASVQILAHSLGSVVAYHGLTGYRVARDDGVDLGRITDIWTIGSPLEKIAFIWPRLTGRPRPNELAATRWRNFRNRSDPISGELRAFVDWEPTDEEVRGGGMLSAHVSYPKSQRFIAAVRDALLTPGEPSQAPVSLVSGRRRRFAEGLALLVGLVTLLAAGLLLFAWVGALITGMVWGVGWLVGRAFDGLGRDITDLSRPIGFWVALAMFVMLLLVSPLLQARSDHPRWRAAVGEEPG